VFTSWGEVGPLIVGVSKAIFQRFDSWQEANEFVSSTQALKKQRTDGLPSGTPDSDVWYAVTNRKTGHYEMFLSWPAAQIHLVNVNGASVRKFRTYREAQEYTNGHAAAWQQKTANFARPPESFNEYPAVSTVPPALSQFSTDYANQAHGGMTKMANEKNPLSIYPPGMLMGGAPHLASPMNCSRWISK
jgi:hypothetical protein